MHADASESGGRVQRKRGDKVGKGNQVVGRRAETLINPCNSSRSKKQMKENRQRLPGRSKSVVGQRAMTLVNLCSALDNRLANNRLRQIDCRAENRNVGQLA